MDFKYVWPTAYSCYKEVRSLRECVYDAGMILATNYTGKWILVRFYIYGVHNLLSYAH